jgi:glutamate synthase domain-containing protein 3
MPQENLNKIYNAGKYFEPKPEQPIKEPTPDENKLSNVKRKINVAKAFMPTQEDPFKKKVEAVLKGIEKTEPASAPATAGKEEKFVPTAVEVIIGTGQAYIGENLAAGKSIYVGGDAGYGIGWHMSGGEIYVKGSAGNLTGNRMSGGEIHVEGNAGWFTGDTMFSGTLRIDGDVASFDKTAFTSDNEGTIVWKKQTIWKNGKKEEPGWTNLKVEEKIAK